MVEFGNEITSRQNLHKSQIINLVRQKAYTIMDASNMYIALYDEEYKLVRFGPMYKDGRKQEIAPRKFEGIGKIGKTEEIIATSKYIFHSTKKEASEWYQQPGHRNFAPPHFAVMDWCANVL